MLAAAAIENQGSVSEAEEFLNYYVNGLEMKMYGHYLHPRIDHHHFTGLCIPTLAPTYHLHIPE